MYNVDLNADEVSDLKKKIDDIKFSNSFYMRTRQMQKMFHPDYNKNAGFTRLSQEMNYFMNTIQTGGKKKTATKKKPATKKKTSAE